MKLKIAILTIISGVIFALSKSAASASLLASPGAGETDVVIIEKGAYLNLDEKAILSLETLIRAKAVLMADPSVKNVRKLAKFLYIIAERNAETLANPVLGNALLGLMLEAANYTDEIIQVRINIGLQNIMGCFYKHGISPSRDNAENLSKMCRTNDRIRIILAVGLLEIVANEDSAAMLYKLEGFLNAVNNGSEDLKKTAVSAFNDFMRQDQKKNIDIAVKFLLDKIKNDEVSALPAVKYVLDKLDFDGLKIQHITFTRLSNIAQMKYIDRDIRRIVLRYIVDIYPGRIPGYANSGIEVAFREAMMSSDPVIGKLGARGLVNLAIRSSDSAGYVLNGLFMFLLDNTSKELRNVWLEALDLLIASGVSFTDDSLGQLAAYLVIRQPKDPLVHERFVWILGTAVLQDRALPDDVVIALKIAANTEAVGPASIAKSRLDYYNRRNGLDVLSARCASSSL